MQPTVSLIGQRLKAKGLGQRAEGVGWRVRRQNVLAKFRFQDLRIWQLAIDIAFELFDIADELEKRKLFRFADQLRGSGLSMSNNIAEGSGSLSNKEFIQYLNIARRSTFENANVVIVLEKRELISRERMDKLLDRLDSLCRQITSFQDSLR
jgi:four helix bundle protein